MRTTRRSPRRSAKSKSNTAALLLTGRRAHVENGGGLYALNRAMAAFILRQIRNLLGTEGLTAAAGVKGAILVSLYKPIVIVVNVRNYLEGLEAGNRDYLVDRLLNLGRCFFADNSPPPMVSLSPSEHYHSHSGCSTFLPLQPFFPFGASRLLDSGVSAPLRPLTWTIPCPPLPSSTDPSSPVDASDGVTSDYAREEPAWESSIGAVMAT